VAAFGFPLRYRLKDLCDKFGFSLRGLVDGGVLTRQRPLDAVTFVDNHDSSGRGFHHQRQDSCLRTYPDP
jgi:alpha-amylase